MSTLPDGGPAFPFQAEIVGPVHDPFTGKDVPRGRTEYHLFPGMTLRDYLAAHATTDDIASYLMTKPCEQVLTRPDGRKEIVNMPKPRSREEAKYAYADAMIAAKGQS